jgi:hypothetical protein
MVGRKLRESKSEIYHIISQKFSGMSSIDRSRDGDWSSGWMTILGMNKSRITLKIIFITQDLYPIEFLVTYAVDWWIAQSRGADWSSRLMTILGTNESNIMLKIVFITQDAGTFVN